GRRDGRGVARPLGGEVGRQTLGGPAIGWRRPAPGGNTGRALLVRREGAIDTSTSLRIRLLGRLEIVAGGVPVRVAGRHAQALVGLLALRPRLRLRDTLAAELWPDADGPSAGALRPA